MKNKALLEKIAAVAVALTVWQVACMIIGQDILLASPIAVVQRLFELIKEADFRHTVQFSLCRIAAGFFCAFATGSVFAALAGRFRVVEILLHPFIVIAKTVPVASFIVISLIWLTSSNLSVFIAFLMGFPIIYTNILQGIKDTDKKLLEMAQIFNISAGKKIMYIYIPQLKPFVLSACSVALGLSWKAGIAAEVIAIPGGSIGEMLYESKLYLDTAGLFAWTAVTLILSIALEKLVILAIRFIYNRLEVR